MEVVGWLGLYVGLSLMCVEFVQLDEGLLWCLIEDCLLTYRRVYCSKLCGQDERIQIPTSRATCLLICFLDSENSRNLCHDQCGSAPYRV